ncbi:MAG: Trk system potassium transporter TrkA [Clostridiaceae bacterium]|nr:Trk system potassium transporter TrkA [Clostridiaceae bacterium]
MRIVVAGAGKLGETLCIDLANEGHDILLIEKDGEIIQYLMERSDISGITGSCVDYDVQMEADVPNSDLFIAVTGNDEINLLSAILADRLGAKYTVAGVNSIEYGAHMSFWRQAFGISRIINPKFETAKEIVNNINSPSSISVESFASGRVYMHEVMIESNSQLIGMQLSDFRKQFSSLIVCAVLRGDEVYIPHGSFILEEGDIIQITGLTKDLNAFYTTLGKINKKIENILIIGGGEITDYLCSIFMKQKNNAKITVIEKNHDVAWRLAAEFPDITILEGDGTRYNVLNDINFDTYDAIVALTGIDEENIMVGLRADKAGIPKIISKVNRTEILPIIKDNRKQTIITPKRIVSDYLIRLARAYENALGSKIEALYRIFDNKAEILEFMINKESKIINTPLRDLELKKDILIVFILRQNEIIFPTGNDMILPDDHIVIFSQEKNFNDIDDILIDKLG